MLKIGIIRETKNPPDRRVPLTPRQILRLQEMFPSSSFIVQPSPFRCYSDEEYKEAGIRVYEDLTECNILLGIKEVNRSTFIAGKTYLFFAHVGKKQKSNREMFRTMAEKGITLIDYEYLTNEKGERVVAFGHWAGIVGAYNGLRVLGIKKSLFDLKPASQSRDYNELLQNIKNVSLPSGLKILVTGTGRVAGGIMEILEKCDIKKVSPHEYLSGTFNIPVVCQIGPEYYVRHKKGKEFVFSHFIENPGEYESAFFPFAEATDVLMTGHYWDPASPKFLTIEDMKKDTFRISVIADISCDVNGPLPSTVRPSTISEPFYDFNPVLEREEPPFSRPENITVMAVDNLPGELPRDASVDFGNQLMQTILPEILQGAHSPMKERATILLEGRLTPRFSYLADYLK
ncbi:MAG: alanine dehydrogenase [Bacteroidales bacterium]|nr:alanine dehydrogenase [Bacteroidales bacterium]